MSNKCGATCALKELAIEPGLQAASTGNQGRGDDACDDEVLERIV